MAEHEVQMEIDSSRTVVVLTALDREQRAVRALLRNLSLLFNPPGRCG